MRATQLEFINCDAVDWGWPCLVLVLIRHGGEDEKSDISANRSNTRSLSHSGNAREAETGVNRHTGNHVINLVSVHTRRIFRRQHPSRGMHKPWAAWSSDAPKTCRLIYELTIALPQYCCRCFRLRARNCSSSCGFVLGRFPESVLPCSRELDRTDSRE